MPWCAAKHLADRVRHDRVGAIGGQEPRGVHAAEAEDHRRVLHSALVADERRETRHRDEVGVAACIDGQLGAQLDRPFLRPRDRAVDAVALQQCADNDRVEEQPHTGLAQEVIGGLAPDQRVVDAGERLPVAHRRRQAAFRFEEPDELVGETEHHLLGRRRAVVGGRVEAADRTGHPRDSAAAAEPVALDERDAQAPAGRGDGGGDARGAAAYDQHVGVEFLHGPAVDGRHRGLLNAVAASPTVAR